MNDVEFEQPTDIEVAERTTKSAAPSPLIEWLIKKNIVKSRRNAALLIFAGVCFFFSLAIVFVVIGMLTTVDFSK